MKFLLALLLLPTIGFAQITVTEADFGNAGDTARMSSTTDPGVDFASTGANWNWDYSAFVAEEQTLVEFNSVSSASQLVQILFGGFAPSDYQADYFAAFDDLPIDQLGQFLPVNISNMNQFSKITADSVSSLGISIDVDGNQIPFRSDSIEKRYALPLNFGDTYTGFGKTEMDLNPFAEIIWRQRRWRTSVVDGWGSITLPMGTFDVLRVKHTIEENDSLYQDFFGTGNPTWFGIDVPTVTIYEWITNGEKEVVLRIETSDLGGFETVTNIEYRDTYDPLLASIDEHVIQDVEVYPNPATNMLHVDIETSQLKYTIVDASGKIVRIGSVSEPTIDLSQLPSGQYTLVGETEKGTLRIPFVKE
ncbi:MAG: T9SS type A sorting domain-containing protein [bacterium]|nr:T9SS type A sorting domain-containing protein [bacterium]